MGRQPYLFAQRGPKRIEPAGHVGTRLGDEIDGPQFQRQHGLGRALGGEGGNHHHRHGAQTHDFLQEGQPVHIGHFDIERHHVGIELLDLFAGVERVLSRPDHDDVALGGQHPAQHIPDQRGIVDDENLDGGFHAAASLVPASALR